MAADGQFPTEGNPPAGGNDGASYATDVEEEGAALWNRARRPLTQTGGTNNITATASPAVTALASGMGFWLIPTATTTGAATLDVGTGAVDVKRIDGTATQAGDIVSGTRVHLDYDGTVFRITTAVGALAAAVNSALFRRKFAAGVAGGTATSGSVQAYVLNETVYNGISGASIDTGTGIVTLPAGEYLLRGYAIVFQTGHSMIGLWDEVAADWFSGQVFGAIRAPSGENNEGNANCFARLSLSASTTLSLKYQVETTKATDGLGQDQEGSQDNHFGALEIIALTGAEAGPAGPPAGYRLTWDTDVTDTDPGQGGIKADNATAASITKLWIDNLDNAGNDITGWLDRLDDGNSGVDRGEIRIEAEVGPDTSWLTFKVAGNVTDKTGYREVPVTYLHGDVMADATVVALSFVPAGDTGPTGPNVGLDYAWSTATAGDPGAGQVRTNNATFASVTQIAIDDVDRNAVNHETLLQALDNSTNGNGKAIIYLIDTADRGNWQAFRLTSVFSDATGYWTGTVTPIDSGGTLANGAVLSVLILPIADERPLIRGALHGMNITFPGSPAPDVTISEGACRDKDDGTDIVLASAMTKGLDGTWVAGSGNGGRSSSVSFTASTWYHVFAIIVGGSADVGFDTDPDGANLITDHSATAVRLLWSVKSDATPTNVLPYQQFGNWCTWPAPIEEFSRTDPPLTRTNVALSVPTGRQVLARINALLRDSAEASVIILEADQNDVAPALGVDTLSIHVNSSSGRNVVEKTMKTNTSGQITYRSDDAAVTEFAIATLGWAEDRGRYD